jgi:hypothetical protein
VTAFLAAAPPRPKRLSVLIAAAERAGLHHSPLPLYVENATFLI